MASSVTMDARYKFSLTINETSFHKLSNDTNFYEICSLLHSNFFVCFDLENGSNFEKNNSEKVTLPIHSKHVAVTKIEAYLSKINSINPSAAQSRTFGQK